VEVAILVQAAANFRHGCSEFNCAAKLDKVADLQPGPRFVLILKSFGQKNIV